MGFPETSPKVEMLLDFLGDNAGVEGSGEVLLQVDSKDYSR